MCVCVHMTAMFVSSCYQQSECWIIFKMSVWGSFLVEFASLLPVARLQLEKEVLCAMFVHIKCLHHFAM